MHSWLLPDVFDDHIEHVKVEFCWRDEHLLRAFYYFLVLFLAHQPDGFLDSATQQQEMRKIAEKFPSHHVAIVQEGLKSGQLAQLETFARDRSLYAAKLFDIIQVRPLVRSVLCHSNWMLCIAIFRFAGTKEIIQESLLHPHFIVRSKDVFKSGVEADIAAHVEATLSQSLGWRTDLAVCSYVPSAASALPPKCF